jgi:hypothetical protein
MAGWCQGSFRTVPGRCQDGVRTASVYL